MLIRTQKTPGDWFMLHKQPVENDQLSWKAKGLLAYLMSKPSGWEIRMHDLVKHATDGESAVRSGLRELEIGGYLVRRREHDEETGHFRWISLVYETPAAEEMRSHPDDRKHAPSPSGDFPQMDNPLLDNRQSNNNDSTNNESSKETTAADAAAPFEEQFPSRLTVSPLVGAYTARDLQTQEGRDAALAHTLATRRQRIEQEPEHAIESVCPSLAKYDPPVEVDRAFVIRTISTLTSAGVPLDYTRKSEVRYWINETESLGRKCGWRSDVIERALQTALASRLSIKGPQSIAYAVADVLREQSQESISAVAGGPALQLHKIRVEEQ